MTVLRHYSAAFASAALALTALSTAPGALAAQLSEPHLRLQELVGEWRVRVGDEIAGTATGRTRLVGQFVEVHIRAEAGPVRNAIYTFGWDDRHERYIVSAMDETGTYWVDARGVAEGDRIPMYGTDDDPVMAEMGLEKAFVIELALATPDSARIETRLIDTRTEARTELPFFGFTLVR
jgi:hypothetical protein